MGVQNISVSINPECIDYKLFRDYFDVYFNEIISSNSRYEIFRDRSFNRTGDDISIPIFNRVEYGLMKDIIGQLKLKLDRAGYGNINMGMDIEKDEDVNTEINRDMEVERLILYTRSLRGIIGSTELARVHVVKRSY